MTPIDVAGQQLRVIYSLITRDVKFRTKTSPIGLLSLIVEPLAFILMMTLIFSYIRMRSMDLGEFLILFFATGIIPLYAFKGMLTGARMCLMRSSRLMYFSLVRPIDILISGTLIAFLTNITLFYIIVYALVFLYDYRGAQNLILCMVPVFCNALIGLGMGIALAIAAQFFRYITVIAGTLFGPVNILSGVFYTAETLPPQALAILKWNPFLHSTELMRTFYYYEYVSPLFDPYYYFGWVLFWLAVGLGLERLMRHRILAMAG